MTALSVPRGSGPYIALAFALLGYSAVGQQHVVGNSTIAGRVTDAEGGPISAQVIVYSRPIENGVESLAAVSSCSTDTSGTYQCKRLLPGKYVVAAQIEVPVKDVVGCASDFGKHLLSSGPSLAKASGKPPFSSVSYKLYYPSAANLGEAEAITLRTNDTEFADLIAPDQKFSTVAGILPSKPGAPVFNILVHGGGYDLLSDAPVQYDATTGQFCSAPLVPGTYVIQAEWTQAGIRKMFQGSASLGTIPMKNLALTEVRRYRVTGVLSLNSDDPLRTVAMPKSIVLDGTTEQLNWRLAAPIKPDGTFAFPEINDGAYLIHTPLGSASYVAGTTIRGSYSSGDEVMLKGSDPSIGIRVDIRPTYTHVAGKIELDTHSAKEAGLTLVRDVDERVFIARPDSQGLFVFSNLPPGTYRLYAWAELDQVAYRSPRVLEANEAEALTVSLAPDTQLSGLQPELIETAKH